MFHGDILMANVLHLLSVYFSPWGFRRPSHPALLGVEGSKHPLSLLPPVRKDQSIPQLRGGTPA